MKNYIPKSIMRRLNYLTRKFHIDSSADFHTFIFLFYDQPNGYNDMKWVESFGNKNIDEMVLSMFELSLTKSIMTVNCEKIGMQSLAIDVVLTDSKDGTTNIDAEVIEKLMGMLI